MPGSETFTLPITSLAHDGRGIGFMPAKSGRGKAVFVAGALPGQTVTVAPLKDRGTYLEADCEKLLECSWQAEPVCQHWHDCGGCPLLPMPYDLQIGWKERLARDAMLRIGRMESGSLDAIWNKPLRSPALSEFRNKIELAFGPNDGALALGFRSRRSHAVFPLRECRLFPRGMQSVIAMARGLASKSGRTAYCLRRDKRKGTGFWRFLVLRQAIHPPTGKKGYWALCITSPGSQSERRIVKDIGCALLEACPDLLGFAHEERGRHDMLALGERRVCCLDESGLENTEAASLAMTLGGQQFMLDIASFFQVNSASAELLAQMALDLDDRQPKGEGLLDLFCGVGAPGQLLAPAYGHVFGIEQDARAIEYARRNASSAGFGQCLYQAGAAEAGLASSGVQKTRAWNTALVDPPRAGLTPGLIDHITKTGAERIIYISCNPATMARDAAILNDDYEPVFLGGVDMFPHTPHLECCGLWLRR